MTGEPWAFSFWNVAYDEPSDTNNEDHAEYNGNTPGPYWNDNNDDGTARSFIVELE